MQAMTCPRTRFLPSIPFLALSITPCRAAPIYSRGAATDLGGIVANFQDLSAVLSLFAADSVEKKLSDPKSSDWERMSSFWSVFGIVGAVRVYAKIAAGLAGAETAGMELGGSRAYTSRRTKRAACACSIGQSGPPFWKDDDDLLLGLAKVESSLWIRPHVVVMGYSLCPFTGTRVVREVSGRGFFMLLTLVITCGPVILLRTSVVGTASENIGIAMSASSALLGGCLLPMILQRWNPIGVAHLPDLTRREEPLAILQPGDTVVTSSPRLCRIMWQRPGTSPSKGSADFWYIRVMGGIATSVTLIAYVINYLLLGVAGTWRSYTWLGSQVAILIFRYVLWAYRPHLLGSRRPTMVYVVTGSLAPPLPVNVDFGDWSSTHLPRHVVYFAVASAKSKLLNSYGVERHIKLSNLEVLSGIAPRDVLQPACRGDFCDIREMPMEVRIRVRVVKLPWSVVEELYAAQGLILGHNPWVLGGISLAAVIDPVGKADAGGVFIGLTTVHSCRPTDLEGVYEFDRSIPGAPAREDIVGITYDNYGLTGTIELGFVAHKLSCMHQLRESHEKFRANVAACRDTAKANGPLHCEVHVQEFGDGTSTIVEHNSKTEPSLDDVLQYGRDVIWDARNKDHSKCTEVCKIFGF